MRTTRGWYIFADGYIAWFSGLTGMDKYHEIKVHGSIIQFRPTN